MWMTDRHFSQFWEQQSQTVSVRSFHMKKNLSFPLSNNLRNHLSKPPLNFTEKQTNKQKPEAGGTSLTQSITTHEWRQAQVRLFPIHRTPGGSLNLPETIKNSGRLQVPRPAWRHPGVRGFLAAGRGPPRGEGPCGKSSGLLSHTSLGHRPRCACSR